MSRRVVYSVAMSLDGYIARRPEDGAATDYSWIPDEPGIDWGAFMGRFDTVLMGRKSYEIAQAMGGGGPPGARTYVFSTTLRQADHPKVTVVSGDPAATVAALRQERGKDIWLFGGGALFRSLLTAGGVDVVEIGLVPVLLGGGIPLLPPGGPAARLTLAKAHRYETSGIIMLTYEVARGGT